ncbi:sphingomyelin phosphodiesteras-like protein [Aureobasidium pullulans]|nr:sphingomyelin phosphodiesteras-like protein [Aureobasidium pullulans]
MGLRELLFPAALWLGVVNAQSIPSGAVSSHIASSGFPTSVFSSYWVKPVATAEPQPALYDPVLNITFPLNLTDPDTISEESNDPVSYPSPIANLTSAGKQAVLDSIISQVKEIIGSEQLTTNCSKCIASLTVAKSAAQLAPELIPDTMVSLCKKYKLQSNETCEENYEATTFGAVWTQILALSDVAGLDGQYICNRLSSTFCSFPKTSPLNTTGLFKKPKPTNYTIPKASGERIKVLHMSDIHLDPRYAVGSEANCTSSLCCRANNFNTALPTGEISLPAPYYGDFKCDSPYGLVLAALDSIAPLTGTNQNEPFGFSIYTGDLVSHEGQQELSREYVEYAELSIYDMLKKFLHKTPVYAVLGNHDTNPEAIDAPHSLPGDLGMQMSWNFDHVAGLWQEEGWLNSTAANQARLHYGAYSVKTPQGLRVITFNTDFWYRSNYLNLIDTINPDKSGMFAWMIEELQRAEDVGERVWILGHVLSGWDGTNPMPNPTDLFYQIIDRYSPHVIANVFFGHTHEDFAYVYYANNGTNQSAGNALNTAWVGPSITPLTNVNSAFRSYEVDTGDWNIYEAYTFYSDVESFSSLNTTGPTFQFEYNTRNTYGPSINWPAESPLNATFWHLVSEQIEKNTTLASTFNTYQGKSSVKSPNCTNIACAKAKACYMRSGSVALGSQCPQGYGSVQSPFKPTS